MHISIVSPLYKGEKMLDELVRRCEASVSAITDDYELVLVNDNSPDATWLRLCEICAHDRHIKAVDLSRNFGQHAAISAGLGVASGDWVVVMDCDLQDRPEEIPRLYAEAQKGYDIVYARRIIRKDKYLKRLSSTIFHRVYDWLSDTKTDATIANFGIYRNTVTQEVCKIPDQTRFLGMLVSHLGFRVSTVNVQHDPRAEGKSSYTLAKLLKLAFDNSIANSNKPLRIVVVLGIIMSLLSFIMAIYNVVARLIGIITIAGFTTTIFSIWFVGGLMLLVLGIIGLYIGKIYDQVKGRPYVVIREIMNGGVK